MSAAIMDVKLYTSFFFVSLDESALENEFERPQSNCGS